jgi:tetratricopeptide (TPR) repeat protein
MTRVAATVCVLIVAAAIGASAVWRFGFEPAPAPDEASLPVPPFPPRITESPAYEACLATLANDPASAVAIAESWQAGGGGEGALHCRGLALIAAGKPAAGAEMLEQLSRQGSTPDMARALVLGQAVQARLMVGQADVAAADATAALALAPDAVDLMIMRATAEGAMARYDAAVDDLNQALAQDPGRADALLNRAVARRKMNQLEPALADVSRALVLDPDNADALLERGILRQRVGDANGARADWQRARDLDPNGTTADLAEQNLSLLDAGPRQR